MEPITAYPLCWPPGWPRTPRHKVKSSLYSFKSMARVRIEIDGQVRLLKGTDLILSTNIILRLDGAPRSGQKPPLDPGVAVYFKRKGNPLCFACDRWLTPEENLWAICLTIDALRKIERAGVSDMLERAFTGFVALPAPPSWWDVLGVSKTATPDEIKTAYRNLAKQHHPDAGGSVAEFQKVQAAYDAAIKE